VIYLYITGHELAKLVFCCNESSIYYLIFTYLTFHCAYTENSNFMSSISVLYKHNMQNI